MADLSEIIHSPEQKSGEFWQLASGIMADHTRLLTPKVSDDGQEQFLLTPSFVPSAGTSLRNFGSRYESFEVQKVVPQNKLERDALSQSYAIAAQVEPRKGYRKSSPLYLIINNNITTPLLQFDRQTSRLMRLDGSFAALEKSDETVGKILKYIDKAMDAKQSSINSQAEAERASHKSKRRTLGAIAAGVLAFGGGVTGFVHWRTGLAEDERRVRQEFDERNIVLDVPGTARGQLSFVKPEPEFFAANRVPGRHDNEPLNSPRLFKVAEGACSQVVILGKQEDVHLVTNAPQEQLYAVVNSAGVVQACSFKSEQASNSNSTEFKVAAQVAPRQSS